MASAAPSFAGAKRLQPGCFLQVADPRETAKMLSAIQIIQVAHGPSVHPLLQLGWIELGTSCDSTLSRVQRVAGPKPLTGDGGGGSAFQARLPKAVQFCMPASAQRPLAEQTSTLIKHCAHTHTQTETGARLRTVRQSIAQASTAQHHHAPVQDLLRLDPAVASSPGTLASAGGQTPQTQTEPSNKSEPAQRLILKELLASEHASTLHSRLFLPLRSQLYFLEL